MLSRTEASRGPTRQALRCGSGRHLRCRFHNASYFSKVHYRPSMAFPLSRVFCKTTLSALLRGFHDIPHKLFIFIIGFDGFPTFSEILLHLTAAPILSAVVGLEREQKEHTAKMLYY